MTLTLYELLQANKINCNIIHTKPAIIRPPIVPCDVTDATAIRVARDQSSDLAGKFDVLETYLRESMLSAGDVIQGGICRKYNYLYPFTLKM